MSDRWGNLRPDQVEAVVEGLWNWLQAARDREEAAERRHAELVAAVEAADQNAERRNTELVTAVGSVVGVTVGAVAAGLRAAADALERGMR